MSEESFRYLFILSFFLCMQFQIAFDLTAKYPTVEPEPFAEGRVSYNIYYWHA